LLILVLPSYLDAKTNPDFKTFFHDNTLRIDYYHIADAYEELFTLDKIYQEGAWSGHHASLIDPFDIGQYYIKVYDIATNKLVYSRGFDSPCGEYRTTNPAKQTIKKTYHESALIPLPRRNILFVLEARGDHNLLSPGFTLEIDPNDYHISHQKEYNDIKIYELIKNGTASQKVDIVIISEGYTSQEIRKYKSDLDRIVKIFFSLEPYKSNQNRFNIYGLFSSSNESGCDEPRKGIYKNTTLNASFNTFDSQRYLLTENNKQIRDIARIVPYDAIIIVVNSARYGGGGIYNTYAIISVDHPLHEYLLHHEIGHSFAGLADEYYTSVVAYEGFYQDEAEPVAPNITALMDIENIKWKKYLSPGINIPTEWRKDEFDSLTTIRSHVRVEGEKTISDLIAKGIAKDSINVVRAKYRSRDLKISQQIDDFFRNHPLRGKIGAFEGAGYKSKGLYRPTLNSIMHKFMQQDKSFYKISEQAILDMINYYASP
jgi:hypothetical protein